MNKILPVLLVLFFSAAALRGAPILPGPDPTPTVATGGMAPELSGAWTRGNPVKLADQRGKKLTVLYFWAVSQSTLADLPRFREVVKRFADQPVVFVGIGCDEFRKVSKFSEVWNVPVPVLADDKLEMLRRFLRKSDRVPLAVVIDKEGRLVWRGKTAVLPRALDEISGGKFDLKESIRREKLAKEISAALAKGHYEDALKQIDAELARDAANAELVSIKALILIRDLKRPADGLAAIDKALEAAPRKLALYDLKLRMLHLAKLEKHLPELYDKLCANFADRPMVLLRYGELEMNRPLKDNRPELFHRLITAAYRAPKFKDEHEQGIVTVHYARMLHQCGMPMEAYNVTRKALALLKNKPEYEEVKELYIYFARSAKMQQKLLKQKDGVSSIR